MLLLELAVGFAWIAQEQRPPSADEMQYLHNSLGYCRIDGSRSLVEYLRTSTYYGPGLPLSACPFYAVFGHNHEVGRTLGLVFLLGVMAGTYLLA